MVLKPPYTSQRTTSVQNTLSMSDDKSFSYCDRNGLRRVMENYAEGFEYIRGAGTTDSEGYERG